MNTADPRLHAARTRANRLLWQRDQCKKDVASLESANERLTAQLALAPKVDAALEVLSSQLFRATLDIVERGCTHALQEVLDDSTIALKAQPVQTRGAAGVEFAIERSGQSEDILRGQGGSVANILSVSLRMLALATRDERVHRRFLVLDEQDCWLRPDLVPKFIHIIREAARHLQFQVIVISHHDRALFERYADKIYEFAPSRAGVQVREVHTPSSHSDGDDVA